MNKLEYIARSLTKLTNKKYELYVISRIIHLLNDEDIEFKTQFSIDGGKYFIDLFFVGLNIAVEIYEAFHSANVDADIKRENEIKKIKEHCLVEKIKFILIEVYNITLEALNDKIDDVVAEIKDKKAKKGNIKWLDDEQKLEQIMQTKYLPYYSSFKTNAEILRVFGKNFKQWYKGGYPIKGHFLWFPTLSVVEEGVRTSAGKREWMNTFNPNTGIIIEASKTENLNSKDFQDEITDQTTRLVFMKQKNDFGEVRKYFIGEFKANKYDDSIDEFGGRVYEQVNRNYTIE